VGIAGARCDTEIELRGEPKKQINDGWHLHGPEPENSGQQSANSTSRIQDEVSSEHSCYRSAGADDRYAGLRCHRDRGKAGGYAGTKVKLDKTKMTEVLLNRGTKHEQIEHISRDM